MSAPLQSRAPAPEDWRVLLGVSLYRLLLITLLLVVYQSGYGVAVFDELLPRYFRWTCIAYAVIALILPLPVVYRTPQLRVQAHLHFIADTFGVAALVYASGGVPNGLGVLLVLPALGCGLLLSWRMALVQAAGATLVMFSEELIRQSGMGFSPSEFTQTGLLGLMFFATSSAGSYVAARARKSEQLAEKVGSEFADLSRLNDNIIESMQAGVVVVDADGVIRTVNRAATRLIGGGALLGQLLAQQSPVLAQALQDWQVRRSYPQTLRAHDDAPEITPRFSRLGFSAQAPVLILLDDAALLQSQAQQMKLVALGRLSASIAHEIRNPLAAITHAGQLLAESDTMSGENQRLLAMIQRHGGRINKIVQDVMELARPESAVPQELVLKDWLPRTIALYQEGFAAAPRRIELGEIGPELRARFDPNHLQQVLFNLWDNSFDHGGSDAQVQVRAGLEPGGLTYLECADRGPGIARELLDRIFEPFFTTSTRGTGLGLYLSRELCEYNLARLRQMPPPSGETGARFRILFAPIPE